MQKRGNILWWVLLVFTINSVCENLYKDKWNDDGEFLYCNKKKEGR